MGLYERYIDPEFYVKDGEIVPIPALVASSPVHKNGVFLVHQEGTQYYKVGYVHGNETVEELLKLAQEGSVFPLKMVSWNAIDGNVAEIGEQTNSLFLHEGSPAMDDWVAVEGNAVELFKTDLAKAMSDDTSIVSAGNPCHQPSGSAVGGQFAPKGSCGVSGAEGKPVYRSWLGKLKAAITGDRVGYLQKEVAKAEAKAREAEAKVPPKYPIIPVRGPQTSIPIRRSGSVGVYVIQSGNTNYFKIGKTVDINERLDTLQTGSPEPLRVVAFHGIDIEGKSNRQISAELSALERRYQRQHAAKRKANTGSAKEWFVGLTPEEIAKIGSG